MREMATNKIKIQITMTDEEAMWLEQLLFMEEETPHRRFFMRVRDVVDRARVRALTPHEVDALCGCGSNLPASINGVACPSCFADTGRP